MHRDPARLDVSWHGCALDLVEIVTAVVHELDDGRCREHTARGTGGRCDLGLVVAGRPLVRHGHWTATGRSPVRPCADPCQDRHGAGVATPAGHRFELTGDCSCVGLVLHCLTAALLHLERAGAGIVDRPAAARVHVRMRQHDHLRETRRDRGAQTRVDRLADGEIGRRLDTEAQRRLLEDVADEAGSGAPLEGDDQLLRRLALRRSNRDGGDPEAAMDGVRRDYATVREACRQGRRVNVGSRLQPELVTWWEAYVERPLGRRGRRSTLSLDAGTATCRDGMERLVPPVDHCRSVVLRALSDAVDDRPDASDAELLEAVLDHAVTWGALPVRSMTTFRHDPVRVDDALAALAELVRVGGAGPTPRGSVRAADRRRTPALVG